MSKMISELQEKDSVEFLAMIQHVSKGVNPNQDYYLILTLQDQSGSIDSRYWSVKDDELEKFKVGMIVKVKGNVISHRKSLQFRVASIEEVKDQIDYALFVKSGPFSKEILQEQIKAYIDQIQNSNLKLLVETILNDYEDNFYTYPAAVKNHHDYLGGLATHTLGMLKINDGICEQYSFLDKDLLISGILLHDLGKLIELSGVIGCEYTPEGNLIGHISLVYGLLERYIEKLNIQGEELMLLRHMVLSHHGKHEYGSPVLPMIAEAEILSFIDNIDARMQSFEKQYTQMEKGTFSPRIFALENRMIYKKK